MERIFRALVLASVFITLALWAIPYFRHFWIADEDVRFLNIYGYKAIFNLHEGFYYIILSAWLLVFAGLVLFKRKARAAFVVLLAGLTLFSPFLGWIVFTPVEWMLQQALGVFKGIILFMAYLSPLSKKFQ